MNARIRKAEPRDGEHILSLYVALDDYHRNNLPSFFQEPDRAFRDSQFLRDRLADTNSALFLAEVSEIVGMVAVGLHYSPDLPIFSPQKRASISDIYVSPDFRREGVARRLIAVAEKWAKENGASAMDLTVYEFNQSARELFEEMGYSTFTRRMVKDNLAAT